MNQPKNASELISSPLDIFRGWVDAMPDETTESAQSNFKSAPLSISSLTGLPKSYREPWTHPTEILWKNNFALTSAKIDSRGMVALIGKRGTGKTQLAAEVLKSDFPESGRYATAMAIFLRLRASYGKDAEETELQVVNSYAKAAFLIIDEVQERGNTAWEDRILTHILDCRYANRLPTILIANLTPSGLAENLGGSIVSRLNQVGSILEINGPSHRTQE